MEVIGSLLTFCDSTFWSLAFDVYNCYLIEDNSIQHNGDVSPESHRTMFATLSKAGWQQNQGKGKAIPLQAWTDPEVSRRLRLPDFKTIST